MNRTFTIKIEYYKTSGKFYASEKYEDRAADCGPSGHPCCYMQDVIDHLFERVVKGTPLPGLAGSAWDGPVRVDCEQGYPVLLVKGLPRDPLHEKQRTEDADEAL